jgi:hypothetical protein
MATQSSTPGGAPLFSGTAPALRGGTSSSTAPALRGGASFEHPLPADWNVEAGRNAYLDENGFTIEAYSARYTPASFLGVPINVPNTPKHQWAIKLHDLHHVATGYGTNMVGEAEISAWEAHAGVKCLGLYVGAIVVSLALFGLLIAPRRTLRAWRAGGKVRSLFGRDDLAYDALLQLSVRELRALLGVPEHGLAEHPRALHSRAPAQPTRLTTSA